MTTREKAKHLMNNATMNTAKWNPDTKEWVEDIPEAVKEAVNFCTAVIDPQKNPLITKADIHYWQEVADHCRKYLPANE
jgi:hypothetical protein